MWPTNYCYIFYVISFLTTIDSIATWVSVEGTPAYLLMGRGTKKKIKKNQKKKRVAKKNGKPNSAFNKPGWSKHVATLYQHTKQTFEAWKAAGKPRDGVIQSEYVRARARHKYAIRFIKRHEQGLRKDSLAKKLVSNSKGFWKDVKKTISNHSPLPNVIDGVSGEIAIAQLWKGHFSAIFNSVNDEPHPIADVIDSGETEIPFEAVKTAIEGLKCNKACGSDKIYAEHLKYASASLLHLLSLCFSFFLYHGTLPESVLSVVLVPVIKNKSGQISSKDNYRPIALASVISKVLETVLLDRLQEFIVTQPNQYGFKKQSGPDQCIYVLKELACAHRELKGNIYMCFLDASKAFDRVNHRVLFNTLRSRGVPNYLIRILLFWYTKQKFHVRWGNTLSSPFSVSNGVRQGGILSPYLFNVYMDKLSMMLNTHDAGCYAGNLKVNHLMYADDVVIIAPSASGLQSLLNICK